MLFQTISKTFLISKSFIVDPERRNHELIFFILFSIIVELSSTLLKILGKSSTLKIVLNSLSNLFNSSEKLFLMFSSMYSLITSKFASVLCQIISIIF